MPDALPFYRPIEAAELGRLLADCPTGRLLTVDETGTPACGLLHFIHFPGRLEFHLLHENPQLAHLRAGSKALFEVDEYLAPIPSHWVDRHDGAAFTGFYRAAQIGGRIELDESRGALAGHFNAFLDKYQPEKGYDRFAPDNPDPADQLTRFVLARLSFESINARWHLGQNHPPELRRKLIDKLHTRGRGNDPKAADELLRWLMAHPEEDLDPLKYE